MDPSKRLELILEADVKIHVLWGTCRDVRGHRWWAWQRRGGGEAEGPETIAAQWSGLLRTNGARRT